MPRRLKKISPWVFTASLLVFLSLNPLYGGSSQGINLYYIRFDTKSSNHRIIDNRLTMVPAEKSHRSEIFSQIPVSDIITAVPQESHHTLENKVKKQAFTRLLEQKGLKSVNTMNRDTIISYEGMVRTPVNMRIGPYDPVLEGYPYTAYLEFAPLAFPDQWGTLRQKYKMKEILNDFILLFR